MLQKKMLGVLFNVILLQTHDQIFSASWGKVNIIRVLVNQERIFSCQIYFYVVQEKTFALSNFHGKS